MAKKQKTVEQRLALLEQMVADQLKVNEYTQLSLNHAATTLKGIFTRLEQIEFGPHNTMH